MGGGFGGQAPDGHGSWRRRTPEGQGEMMQGRRFERGQGQHRDMGGRGQGSLREFLRSLPPDLRERIMMHMQRRGWSAA
jgi:hypothetical protein